MFAEEKEVYGTVRFIKDSSDRYFVYADEKVDKELLFDSINESEFELIAFTDVESFIKDNFDSVEKTQFQNEPWRECAEHYKVVK